ncbi:MAG: response regulator [Proteobacteria bacterium]|nr:response regulator [Pseudomonadota bacterium]MBU1687975.1 response regulator [Pseudomonadota bacterium]
MTTILLVDDEAHFRERMGRAFVKRGYEVLEAAEYEGAMEEMNKTRPDLAVFDLRMPGRSGLELVKAALEVHPELKIVVLTGYGSIATAIESIRLGALSYLPKPADVDDILAAFSRDPALEVAVKKELPTPSLARAEWEHINRVLHDCGGNISEAAKRLNVHRRTLQRKLQSFPPYT